MLVNNNNLLNKAKKGKYAVGSFNFQDMETLQAIVNAAKLEKSPVILAASPGVIDYAGLDYVVALVKAADKTSKVKMSLHLDHSTSVGLAKKCILNGFTSVMIDASKYKFDKNVAITKQVVNFAHKRNVSVEAELGRIVGVEDYISVKKKEAILTDPEDAKLFVNKTGCDSLAISIGTSHGAYKFKEDPNLDFERLKVINKKVKVPLVLHGASSVYTIDVRQANKYGAAIKNAHGVPDSMLKKAIKLGINKINTDTDLRLSLTASIRKTLALQPEVFGIRKLLRPARGIVTQTVRKKMKLFGSSGKSK